MSGRFGPFVAIAENIRSLHNVGAIFRAADGAGVSWVFLAGLTGCPPRTEIAKVALGAEDAVSWQHVWNVDFLLKRLKRDGYQLVALERCEGACPLPQFRPQWPLALMVGNEVSGLTQRALRHADAVVDIPMRGSKKSLNVSVAFGVAAFRLAECLPVDAPSDVAD